MTLTDLSFNQFEIDVKLICGLSYNGVYTTVTVTTGDKFLVLESLGDIVSTINRGRK